jgi:RsiW-degrading membrane proteinase PrsW (M82 family)
MVVSYHYDSPAADLLTEGRGFVQPHRPAFWLAMVLMAAGVALNLMSLPSILGGFNLEVAFAYLSTFAFTALFIWVIGVISDLDPKPANMVVGVFALGALAGPTVPGFLIDPLLTFFGTFIADADLVVAFGAATGEEYTKALLLVLVFLLTPWWFRRPLDGIVIAALIGLGLQIGEDISYYSGQFGDPTVSVLETLFGRLVVGGLVGHMMYAAFFGAGFGYAVTTSASTIKKAGALIGTFSLAWLAHFWWDHPAFSWLGDHGLIGLVWYGVVKGLPFLVILVFIVVKFVKDERHFFGANAQPEIDAGVLTDDDVVRLETFGGRLAARREPEGHEEQFRVHHLMRAQLDLVRLHIHGFTEPEVLEEQRAFIRGLKG